MRISIDRPSSGSAPFSGSAAFGGWALDDLASISDVSIAVDGISYGNAMYGGTRADVCNVFSGRPGCPNVGWNFLLDTTTLPDGPHTLAVTGKSSGRRQLDRDGFFHGVEREFAESDCPLD